MLDYQSSPWSCGFPLPTSMCIKFLTVNISNIQQSTQKLCGKHHIIFKENV